MRKIRVSFVRFTILYLQIILLWEKSFWFKSEQIASPPLCGTCAITTNRSLVRNIEAI